MRTEAILAFFAFLGLFFWAGSLSAQTTTSPARSSSGISYQFGTAEERTEVGATEGRAAALARTSASPEGNALESPAPDLPEENFLSEGTTEQGAATPPSTIDPADLSETPQAPPLPPEPDLLLEPLTPEETISMEALEGPLPTITEEDTVTETEAEADTTSAEAGAEGGSLLLSTQTTHLRQVTEPPSLSPPPLTNLLFYLVLLLVLAGVVYYFFQRGFAGAGFGKTMSRRLQIAEIRSLGNRQFLVVAEYEDARVLLGVSPGRIDYLRDLPAPEKPLSSENPKFQPPPETP